MPKNSNKLTIYLSTIKSLPTLSIPTRSRQQEMLGDVDVACEKTLYRHRGMKKNIYVLCL